MRTKRLKLFLFGVYVNVYLRLKDSLHNEFTTLTLEDESVKRFKAAKKEEIEKFDDVCAICLGDMKQAKITNCHHLFHLHCLSLALQTSSYCPTCKSFL